MPATAPTPPDLAFRRGEAIDAALLHRALAEVLRPSFIEHELPSVDGLLDPSTGRPLLEVLVATSGGDPVAIAVHDTDEAGICLLSYLAVRPGLRAGGIGSAMVGELAAGWEREGIDLVLGEIHDPRCHAEGPDERPAARLGFYARQGARLVGPWVQPRLSQHTDRVPGMVLMALRHAGPFAASIPAPTLRTWMAGYYADEEGAVPDDAEYRALSAAYAGDHDVRLRSLHDLDQVAPI